MYAQGQYGFRHLDEEEAIIATKIEGSNHAAFAEDGVTFLDGFQQGPGARLQLAFE